MAAGGIIAAISWGWYIDWKFTCGIMTNSFNVAAGESAGLAGTLSCGNIFSKCGTSIFKGV